VVLQVPFTWDLDLRPMDPVEQFQSDLAQQPLALEAEAQEEQFRYLLALDRLAKEEPCHLQLVTLAADHLDQE